VKTHHFNSERGSVAVEFALLVPVLFLILFGIINFGVLMYNQAVITNAAREGARWAAIHTTTTYGLSCTNAYSLAPVDSCQTAYSYAYQNLISFGGNYLLTAVYSVGGTQ
jgi:Flp pilus assembly protein TadG